ncbi:MAG: FYVE PHD zinc finger [Lasallia pustulata]|uniref:Chromatin modification-related protein n=1 Tax=Lasallia pustulata TaxID=136370 RepID=A0A5M8PQP2_9LECA|nr:MAG: FYVE PHD zinc finger [Lasallia pustulata]
MKTSTTVTAVESGIPPNRRQPLRQTRTNPARTATNGIRPFGGRNSFGGAQDNQSTANPAPGFFPAITHFTDSITALPKEMVRHYTLLKEVEAKTYGPEEMLRQLVNTALNTPAPPRKVPATLAQVKDETRSTTGTAVSTAGSVNDGPVALALAQAEAASQPETQDLSNSDIPRRTLFRDLRLVAQEMLMTLDEKNHLISTANETLNKQLARCESSFKHIDGEISEEARFGILNHWAYSTEKAVEKKGTTAGERTRRDVAAAHSLAAAAAAVNGEDAAALRSESRREALAARKQRNQRADSDFDDGRGATQSAAKRGQGNAKSRKAAEAGLPVNGASVGLGLANGTANPAAGVANKRRKTEKLSVGLANGGATMERALSSVYGTTSGGTPRGTAGSPRSTPVLEVAKKRVRSAAATNGAPRKRTNTNASAANSPQLASSPVVGTFAAAKANSPAPALTQRSQPVRVRQNSSQSVLQDARQRPSSSASNNGANGNSLYGNTADVDKVGLLTGRSAGDTKTPTKEAVKAKGEQPIENIGHGDADIRAAAPVGNRSTERSLKREETVENGDAPKRHERLPSISTSTRGVGKSSKTSTPITTSFPEPPRARPSRATDTTSGKRSHKKGAGLAAQLAAAAAAAEDDGTSMQGDDEDDEDVEEPRYCYCNQVSYGEMVACDMETCPREWFHLDCVGLTRAPTRNAKWYCDECKENLKKGKFGAGR